MVVRGIKKAHSGFTLKCYPRLQASRFCLGSLKAPGFCERTPSVPTVTHVTGSKACLCIK